MGADLILSFLATKKKEPDWEAGKAVIEKMTLEDFHRVLKETHTYDDDEEADEEDLRKEFLRHLDVVRDYWEEQFRNGALIRVGPYRIVIAAEMSWGDSPEFCTPFAVIYEACSEALGFDNTVYDEAE